MYVCIMYFKPKSIIWREENDFVVALPYVHFPTDSEIKILEILLRNGFLLAR